MEEADLVSLSVSTKHLSVFGIEDEFAQGAVTNDSKLTVAILYDHAERRVRRGQFSGVTPFQRLQALFRQNPFRHNVA